MEINDAERIIFKAAKDIRSGFLDGACNLSGVSHSYMEIVKAVNALEKGTEARNNHWAIRYYLDKMASLAGINTNSHGAMAKEYVEADEFYHKNRHLFESHNEVANE